MSVIEVPASKIERMHALHHFYQEDLTNVAIDSWDLKEASCARRSNPGSRPLPETMEGSCMRLLSLAMPNRELQRSQEQTSQERTFHVDDLVSWVFTHES